MNMPAETSEAPDAGFRLLSMNTLGILLLLTACAWSLIRVLSIHHEAADPNVKIIRICHWQLEAGTREALQLVIDQYNQMHTKEGIRVVQAGVTEKVYGQWLNVNLISGTAPDLAEMGLSNMSRNTDSLAKYFMPLGQEIAKPNPYNALPFLDELEPRDPKIVELLSAASWRDTLLDGCRGGFNPYLQDYYSVPTSFHTVRMFYNRELLKAATGSDEAPQSLGALFDICARLRTWAAANKQSAFDPIAGTRYHSSIFMDAYRSAFTERLRDVLDYDRDGELSSMESWAGLQAGIFNLGEPAIASYYDCMRQIFKLFNKNFAAMDRDQAIAAFVQGRAAFMASGSWDASGVFGLCSFPVGVLGFPMPAPGEKWSEFARYPISEAAANGGCPFGVTKSSQHPDIALDFLRFLTSQKWNQRYNQKVGWIPVVIGSKSIPNMAPFTPNPYGIMQRVNLGGGGDLGIKFDGSLGLFMGGEIPYDAFRNVVESSMNDPRIGIDRIWYKQWESISDQTRAAERTIGVQNWRLLTGSAAPDTAMRMRAALLDQAMLNAGGVIKKFYDHVNHKPFPEQP